MCGIAALFGKEFSFNHEKIIQKMTAAVQHRGPDDNGSYCEHQAALGHARLSILDLSTKAHQPMCTEDQRYWITYNGEVYNHEEIREDLIKKGHLFISKSDTEVVLKAYREYGKKCLSRFNGMFAFVIYDTLEKRFFAARDRFGIKPLYYSEIDRILAIGSEIKQFLEIPNWSSKLNHQVAYDYLCWGITDHLEDTFFSGVKSLRGGCYLEGVAGEGFHTGTWYSLKKSTLSLCYKEATSCFRDLLQDAVKLRMQGDVDVGSCLSGGLDSSSIVCLMGRSSHTFSALSHVPKFDESIYIRQVQRKVSSTSLTVTPTIDLVEEKLARTIWHQDEPFCSTSVLAQQEVFKLAHDSKIKVMLDGQGADELLGGYQSFYGCRFYELFRAGKWLDLFSEMKACQIPISPSLLLANRLLPTSLKHTVKNVFGIAEAAPKWLNKQQIKVDFSNPFKAFTEKKVDQHSHLLLTLSHLPGLLRYEDRSSMMHSIEARVPFLDHRVVEFVYALPSEYKLYRGTTKRILRQAVAGIVPDGVVNRRDKMGFETAEEVWVKKERPDLFRKWIREGVEYSNGLISPLALTLLEETISGKRSFDRTPWRIICFGQWAKQFKVTFE